MRPVDQTIRAVAHASPFRSAEDMRRVSDVGDAVELCALRLRRVASDPGWTGVSARRAADRCEQDARRTIAAADCVRALVGHMVEANRSLERARSAAIALTESAPGENAASGGPAAEDVLPTIEREREAARIIRVFELETSLVGERMVRALEDMPRFTSGDTTRVAGTGSAVNRMAALPGSPEQATNSRGQGTAGGSAPAVVESNTGSTRMPQAAVPSGSPAESGSPTEPGLYPAAPGASPPGRNPQDGTETGHHPQWRGPSVDDGGNPGASGSGGPHNGNADRGAVGERNLDGGRQDPVSGRETRSPFGGGGVPVGAGPGWSAASSGGGLLLVPSPGSSGSPLRESRRQGLGLRAVHLDDPDAVLRPPAAETGTAGSRHRPGVAREVQHLPTTQKSRMRRILTWLN